MTIDELSQYLQMPKATLYQYTMKKEIPCYKIGKRVRFNIDEIDKWVKQHRAKRIRKPAKGRLKRK